MLSWENLRARDDRRARRRTDPAPLESLEGRQLLSYSPLGYSLPNLNVRGQAGPVATWGGTLTVTAILQNTGASTINEPLSLIPPGQVLAGPDGLPVPSYAIASSADVPANQINILLTRNPRSLAGAINLGTVGDSTSGIAVPQNDVRIVPTTVQLPAHPAGFPTTGRLYIRLVANVNNSILQGSDTNNVSPAIPVRFIYRAAPSLRVTELNVPSSMQPGDTIAPTIRIVNSGTSPAPAGTEVALVASVSPDFNLGSSIVSLYTLPNEIPAQSSATVALRGRHGKVLSPRFSSRNVNPGANVLTFAGTAATLPTLPSRYYLGVVIDPNNKLPQLSLPANRLEQIRVVGPSNGLPPAGVVSSSTSLAFPNPPDGVPIGQSTATTNS